MRKRAIYLFDEQISGFETPLLEGYFRIPLLFAQAGPDFTIPSKILGTDKISWSRNDYSIFATASKYIANVRSIPKGKYEPEFEEKLLFDGGIILVTPLELVSPSGFKTNRATIGKIWTSRKKKFFKRNCPGKCKDG